MKDFIDHTFNLIECEKELFEFKDLLEKSETLKEREVILPFFRARKNLSVLIGALNARMGKYNKLAYEYSFWGDFSCDLAVADSDKHVFCFIEFENYASDSIFKKVGSKVTLEFAPRFEHGFSQIIDWFYRIDGFKNTTEIKKKFGKDEISYLGILIIGRSKDISEESLQKRLKWREENVNIASQKIHYMTFNQLYDFLIERIDNIKLLMS